MTQPVNTLFPIDVFFDQEYVDFSKYDNVRKIASYIDGQKNAARKILHTVLQLNIDKFTKVSNLGPKVQDYAQYLHGSLEPTVVNMTQSYVGSGNNIPLLQGDGNFGSAFIPEAAATRYIFARMNPILKDLFAKDDYVNLYAQTFEGDKIEPRFYVPVLPLIAINGSEGVSIGFAQKILPRNPSELVKWAKDKALGKKKTSANLTPNWVGAPFKVLPGETPQQWVVVGSFVRKTKYKIVIDSIPVGYTLKQYHAVLDKLLDDKEIRNWTDHSDNDVFNFELSVESSFTEKDDDWILNKLKLVKKLSENFTCIDENNKIVNFETLEGMLDAWYKVRIQFNDLRKQSVLAKLNSDYDYTQARAKFITGVVEGKIELRNKKEAEIMQMTEQYDSTLLEHAKQFLGLPMRVLTSEEIEKLNAKAATLANEITEYSKKTFEDILLDDLANLKL